MFVKNINQLYALEKVVSFVNQVLCRAGIIAFILFFCSDVLFAQQQHSVHGRVLDEDGIPLPGASILIDGTTIGTTTGLEGRYIIDVEEDGVLVISYVGFVTQRVQVEGRSQINIVMIESESFLDEVIIIGYGTESRRMLTTSISSIGNESIEGLPVPSIANAMQGKMAGVRIHHSSGGEPGAVATIRVRGGSSITGNNDPLVLVDGRQRPLRDINPNDIESIRVLKDAASTAIYGSRASNGVVLITTKRGARGDTRLTFNSSVGLSVPGNTVDLVSAEDYLRIARIGATRGDSPNLLWARMPFGVGNDETSPYSPRYLEEGEAVPAGWKSMQDPVDPDRTIIFQDNNMQDVALRNIWEQNYHLSASGGSDNILYSGGIGYTHSEGVAIGTGWERYSGRINVDYYIREYLKLQTNFNSTFSISDDIPNHNHIFGRSLWLAPTSRIYMEDGSYAPGHASTYTNPLWYNDVHFYQTDRRRTQMQAALEWDILPLNGLKATVRADHFTVDNTTQRFEKAHNYDQSRDSRVNRNENRRTQLDAYFNYIPAMPGNHSLSTMLGTSYEYRHNHSVNTRASGGASDLIRTMNASPDLINASNNISEEASLDYFSRVSYNYDRKYLLMFSLRRDASSRFASDNRVGYFPAVSAGWIISEERFFPESFVSMLKIRSSWGKTGNVVSGLYTPFGSYSVGRDYNFMAGTYATSMPNFALGWESTTQRDIGLDVGLFSDRVIFAFEIYDRITNDLLFNTPLPRETGFNNIQQNVGSVKFYGWDFEVQASIIENSRFRWGMNFNYSYNMNEVLSLPDNGRPQNRIGGIFNPETGEGIGGIAEGERMGAITGYVFDLIIDNWEQANNAHHDTEAAGYDPETGRYTTGRKFPGDVEWVDQNGDGIINQYDQVVLGYQTPHSWGGLTNRLSYGNFELNVHLDFTIGHSIEDQVKRRGDGTAIDGAATPTTDMLHAWQEEGDYAAGRAKMPRAVWHDARHQSNIHRSSDQTIYRADFLSIREIKLSYALPQRFNEMVGLTRSSVYVQGQNLHYFTKYPVFNPEFESGGNYGGAEYPIPRKFIAGINLRF